jgi:hypothetical protein
MRNGVLALAFALTSCVLVERPAHAAGACALVCLDPDERLDVGKCACVKQTDAPASACALVCPDGQVLDAAKCVCVKKN